MRISTISIRLLVIWGIAASTLLFLSVSCGGFEVVALLFLSGGGYGMGAMVQDTFRQAGVTFVSFALGAATLASLAVGVARPKCWLISTGVCVVVGGTLAAVLAHEIQLDSLARQVLVTIGRGCS